MTAPPFAYLGGKTQLAGRGTARLPGRGVVISGYAGPLYDELYAGWCRVEFPGRRTRNRMVRTEILWANRQLQVQGDLVVASR